MPKASLSKLHNLCYFIITHCIYIKKAEEPLLGGSLLFTTKFKAEMNVTPPSGFELVYQPSYYQI